MLLKNKNAVIYGAGGAIGSALARAFAREGAKVFLAGRTVAKLDAVTKEISGAGGAAEAAQVDALDEQSVEKHAAKVAQKAGHIDISFNVISIPNIQGTPLVKLSVDDFALPVMNFVKTHFLTARAAARDMVKKKSGVILMMTTTPDRRAIPLVGAVRGGMRGDRSFLSHFGRGDWTARRPCCVSAVVWVPRGGRGPEVLRKACKGCWNDA